MSDMEQKIRKIKMYTVKFNDESQELEAVSDDGHVIKYDEFVRGMRLKEGQILAVDMENAPQPLEEVSDEC